VVQMGAGSESGEKKKPPTRGNVTERQ